ncbi:dienelactone hydrolase family protein [Poseidonocella sp. HB161398]|uniref:dienelactone hydrolase family protein n=1 Tax=Poseidonocella sp. HB161398 TaxID=2320855 RepID=UPI00110804A6|nr:dienelactone hydrolase family protein [Poseidonocella sp. HB161398]
MRRALIWIAALVLLAVALAGANTLRNRAGLAFTSDTLEARIAELAPAARMMPPGRQAPYPVALLFSGCDGVHDNMYHWAEALSHAGYAAVIVDSHGPRGLDKLESWRLVCAGQVLPGAERAGDLVAALEAVAADPELDAGNVVLLGASHGGWTVTEALADLLTGTLPAGIKAWQTPPAELLAGIRGAVLLYPYCGALNGAARGDWTGAPPMLMILGTADSIISTPACRKLAGALEGRGARIAVSEFEGADHGFDQREKSFLSSLVFDEALRDRAGGEIAEFLEALPAR